MIEVKIPHQGTFGYDIRVITIPGEYPTAKGETINLATQAAQALGQWTVLDCWVGEIHRIPAALLEIHFDAAARSFSGLCIAHQMMAGPGAAVPGAKCTALVLKPAGADIQVVKGEQAAHVLAGVAAARRKSA